MSGTGSRGLGKGSKGMRKRGSSLGTSRATMRTSASAAVAIPPIATGRGRLGRPSSDTRAAETQQQQQRVADIFLQPGRSRPIEEKDAESVVELMVDEEATISSATEPSTPTVSPVRRSSSSRPAVPGAEDEQVIEEEKKFSSPTTAGNTSSLSLSSFFTPNTVRVLNEVVGDLGEQEPEVEMLMGTLGDESLDSQTVVTVKAKPDVKEESEGSQQDLFADEDDDRGKDSDWVASPGSGHVSSEEEEEDESVGLARRISIADIGRNRSGRGMQAPQPASSSATASSSSSKQTPAATKPPPTTTGKKTASDIGRMKSGRGMQAPPPTSSSATATKTSSSSSSKQPPATKPPPTTTGEKTASDIGRIKSGTIFSLATATKTSSSSSSSRKLPPGTARKLPPTTTGREAAVPVPALPAPSGRKGTFTSPIWQYYSLPTLDSKYAICNQCRMKLSRGADPAKYSTSSLLTHLQARHLDEHEEFLKLRAAGAGSGQSRQRSTTPATTAQPSAAATAGTRPPAPPAAAAPAGVRKRSGPPSATPSADIEASPGSQSSVASASSLASTDSRASKRPRQSLLIESFQGVVRALPPGSRRLRRLNGLLARAMCSQLLPYNLVQEGSDMRALLQCAAPDWPIPSRHYFSRTAIPALHRFVMANVGRGLDHAVGERVHVTMDSWSSRFGSGRFLSFTAHWVSLVEGGAEEGRAASGTAAAAAAETQWVAPPRRIRGIAAGSSDPLASSGSPGKTPRHSSNVKPRHCQALLELVSLGKNKLTASHVLAKLREQERSWLSPRGLRVGEVVSDNGANLVAAVSRGHLTHIPCLAHVLNLVVQKFLRTYPGMEQLVESAREVVRHFRRSPAACVTLEDLQKELNLPRHRLKLDVSTRWNSTLEMLERLLEQKQAVKQYVAEATYAAISGSGRVGKLPSIFSADEWAHMQQVCSVLAPFLQATNMVSRDRAMVCQWVPLVCLLDRALYALLEEGEAAVVQQEQQAAAHAAQSTSEEEEEEDVVEVPDLAAEEGEEESAAVLVRGWREDAVDKEAEDRTVTCGEADDDVPPDVSQLFPMAAHMLRCLRRDPRVIEMRQREDIWITMMLDPRVKGKLTQFLPAGGDPDRRVRDLERSLVQRLEEAFPPPTGQPAAERQQQVPASSSKQRTKDLLSLTNELYMTVELPGTREEVPAAASVSGHRQRLTRMVTDYMASISGLDSDAPVDPMEYWVKRLEIWSELAQYALEVLSCPPSSVLSERCFSAAGGLVTEKRSRLSPASVDRLTFLKMNQAWAEGEFLAPAVGDRGK